MPKPAPALALSLDHARNTFLHAQGIPAPAGRSPVAAVEDTGFVRTLGGVDVYFGVRSRVPGLTRAELDRRVESRELRVSPAARGCIYLVAERDAALCLRVADLLSRSRAEKDHEKAGIRPGEVEEVATIVLATLGERGPLTTDALRRAMPAGSLRSLGEQGKKVGISSALPGALRQLEFAGEVERALEGGRLDSERYSWRLAATSPFAGANLPADPIDLYARLAEVFFRGAGLGRIKDFAAWAGISQRDAKAAGERLELLPVAIAGVEDEHWLLPANRDLPEQAADTGGGIAFLPFDDNLVAYHGGMALLVDSRHHDLRLPAMPGTKPEALGWARYASYRGIVADGKLAGFWEYDPDTQSLAMRTLDPLPAKLQKRLDEEAAGLAGFIRDDLGHGRSFNLDTDDELRKRTAAIRSLG